MIGLVNRYGRTFPVQNPVPRGWSDWVATRVVGVSAVFWIGLGLTIVVGVVLRYTAIGRGSGWSAPAGRIRRRGPRVSLNQIMVYVVAAVLYAVAGLALAGRIGRPGVYVGSEYLPGADRGGGDQRRYAQPEDSPARSPTFAAALFLTGLNQMMLVMGLPARPAIRGVRPR